MNLRSFFASSGPNVAVGIDADRVAAVAVARHGDGPVISAHASEALPPGAVTPQLNGPNVADRALVTAALRRVFDAIGQRPKRVALALPDPAGKVSLLHLEKVPDRADDLDQMVRWQVRKSVPFPIEAAQVACTRLAPSGDGKHAFLVVVSRRDVVREYEAACEEADAQAGLVDLASLNVINAVLASRDNDAGDWLLVHVTPQYATIGILRGGNVIFYRNRGEEAEGDLAGLVHQTAMYYEDRLGGRGFSRVVLVGAGAQYAGMPSADGLRRSIEERLRTDVEAMRPGDIRFADRIGIDQATLDLYSPLVGLLLR